MDNLNDLNALGNTSVYLTSKVNIETNPAWLYGVAPDSTGETDGAVSCAIIVNDHGNGNVDAFYMYFYAFNYGGEYFGFIIGDHVGDWEHNMVRFANGLPTAVWYSQHSNGEAFTYEAVNKSGIRVGFVRSMSHVPHTDVRQPVVLSANGSHANYAIGGTHDHTIPDLNLGDGLIEDYTDFGPVWDPTLSAYYYTYDADTTEFAAYDSRSVMFLSIIQHRS